MLPPILEGPVEHWSEEGLHGSIIVLLMPAIVIPTGAVKRDDVVYRLLPSECTLVYP